jgi:hypothetical protein
MHSGDRATLLFTSRSVSFTVNDRLMGNITDRHFAEVILAIFIRVAATPKLKYELLGG